MPGLVLFNRILPLSSDDVSIPSLLLFILHLVPALIALLIFPSSSCEPSSSQSTFFIPLFIAIFILLAILDLIIFYTSLQGTISNAHPRRNMNLFIYLYIGVGLLDLVIAIIGSVAKSCTDGLWLFIHYYQWAEIILVTFALGSLFLASARHQICLSERHHHFKRFIAPLFFFASTSVQSYQPQAVLNSVAALLTDLFSSANLCISDVVVGLILVRQSYSDQPAEEDDSAISTQSGESNVIFNLSKIAYYSQYAEAMYGIPLFLFSDTFRGIRYLCCPCFPSQRNQSPVDAIEKTMETGCQALLCCFPGSWFVERSNHPDLIYKSIQGRMFKSPFAVSIDRKTKSIVISVRGTLSTTDLLVDLYIEEQQIEWTDLEGGKNVGFVHGGMLEIAKSILTELEEKRVLSFLNSETCSQMPIICTGHSLGSGVSALLAFLFRTSEAYRNGIGKRTNAILYSSPGFLISESSISYFQTFCTSVVLGDDFVCRINPHNTHDLKEQVCTELQRCNKRKIDIISSEIINQLFEKRRKSPSREPLLKRDTTTEIVANSRIYSGTNLYIPGNVLHLKERDMDTDNVPSSSQNNQLMDPNSEFVPKWIDPIKLGERIIISDKMLVHHLPNRVGEALRALII